MNIDVVLPTIRGREDYFARCQATYTENSEHTIRLWIERDHDCVGKAWNAGAEKALADGWSDYLHLTCDDLEPQPGWDRAAIKACERRVFPSPRMVDGAGRSVEWGRSLHEILNWTRVESTTIPFMPSALWPQIGPSLPIHYYTDDWLSLKALQVGFPSAFCYGYAFLHTWASHGRGAGMTMDERMTHDQQVFERERAILRP